MKKLMKISVALVVINMALMAEGESLFSGSYENKNGNTGDLMWTVQTKRAKGKALVVIIEGSDSAGESTIKGKCTPKGGCDITQTYKSGTYKGKVYFYKGKATFENSWPTSIEGEYGIKGQSPSGTFSVKYQ